MRTVVIYFIDKRRITINNLFNFVFKLNPDVEIVKLVFQYRDSLMKSIKLNFDIAIIIYSTSSPSRREILLFKNYCINFNRSFILCQEKYTGKH